MTLLQLHHFFGMHGVQFYELDTNGYAHCIYINRANNRKFTIPKLEKGHIKTELIHLACYFLEIEKPMHN